MARKDNSFDLQDLLLTNRWFQQFINRVEHLVDEVFETEQGMTKAEARTNLGVGAGSDAEFGTLIVGTGLSSPDGTLHVHTASAGALAPVSGADDLVVENNSQVGISLMSPASDLGQIVFGDSGSAGAGRILYSHSDDSMRFTTNASEVMRIDSSGQLGIGTTSPESLFELEGSASLVQTIQSTGDGQPSIRFKADRSSSGNSLGALQAFWGQSNRVAQIDFPAGTDATNKDNAHIDFYTSSTGASISHRVRITEDGNVGIGTTSPDGTLHVHTASAGTTANPSGDELVLENSANVGMSFLCPSTDAAYILFGDEGSSTTGQIIFNHQDDSMLFYNNGEKMRIESDGKMGLGTNSPDGTLHVFSGSAGTVTANTFGDDLVVENSTNGGMTILTPNSVSGWIFFGDNDDNDSGKIQYSHASNFMAFSTGTAEAMRINSSQQVGIGTSSPDGTLHVQTADASVGAPNAGADNLIIEDNGDAGISIFTPNTNIGNIFFGDPQDTSRGSLTYNHNTDTMAFETAGSSRVLIASDGGMYSSNASGGSQGVDTINFSAVYDDGSQLTTDYVFDAELDGSVDTAKWDAAAEDTVIPGTPERTIEEPVTKKVEVEVEQRDEGAVVVRKEMRDVPVMVDVPVLDEKGNPVTEEEPVVDEEGSPVLDEEGNPVTQSVPVTRPVKKTRPVTIPATPDTVIPRTHEPAREFDLTETDPAAFGAKWKADRKLPAFKRLSDRVAGKGRTRSSVGEQVQALLETCEAQAVHIEKLRQEIEALKSA